MTSTRSELLASADIALIKRMALGDESAVGPLYDRYGAVLYALACRIVGIQADAEEVVAEAFAQVWREAGKFESGRGSVGAWLATIARSRALDLVRARSRRIRITEKAARSEADMALAMSRRPPDPASQTETSERRRQVAAALDTLAGPQRQAIELAFFEGLSHSEIAERLQEPLGTIKTRVRLGLQRLRDVLRAYYFEQPA
ncbi:MAG TPA: sigma-70 family RNA polymerase sigma factor [Gemmatimonadales bacterium]|nr:sigma-70 family RNA polymerase sigma factor [Gemmatimonadales bacterium]